MDKENCVVSIKGMQTYVDSAGDSQEIEMVASAHLSEEDGKYFIEYDETEASGMEGTRTTLEIGKEYVSMMREGKVDTTLLFIKDRITSSYYETPFGTIILGISTDGVENKMTDTGGSVKVKYGISMNNVFSGTNTFEINVRRI